MTINSYQGDTVIIDVTVKKEDGTAKAITGATVDASIRSPSGVVTALSTPTITNALGGVVQVVVAVSVLDVSGTWLIELEVVLSGESQTVYQEEIIAAGALMVD